MADEMAVCQQKVDAEKLPVTRLEPGEMGILLARAGAGKTACLTHLAIRYLLRNEHVLHICVDVVPDKVRVWYHELLKDLFQNRTDCTPSSLQRMIEPNRFIMSFLNQTFSPEKLEQGIEDLSKQAIFTPSLIVLDGLDFDKNSRSVFEKIREIAAKYSAVVWMSARMHRHISDVNERGIPYPVNAADDLFSSILMLHPEGEGVRLKVLKERGVFDPVDSDFLLDPSTFGLLKKPR